MRYNAFFISPGGKIIPVRDRHIVTIAGDPKLFGLTVDYMKETYIKHGEQIPFEGHARNKIILDLLKKEWVRLRFEKRSGTWRLQVHEELNSKLKKNILGLCREVQKGNISNLTHRTADPNIEIHDTNENIIFRGTLDEGIKFLNHGKY